MLILLYNLLIYKYLYIIYIVYFVFSASTKVNANAILQHGKKGGREKKSGR